jgi:small-conductance mechanosensitive channel
MNFFFSKHKLLVSSVLAILVVMGLAVAAPTILPRLVDSAKGNVYRILTQPYFTLGHLPVTPGFLLKAVAFILVLSFISALLQKFLLREVLSHTPWDRGQQYAVSRVLGYLAFLFGLMVGLQSLGVDLSSLAVIGGALGVGAGFGLQPIVANFVSGLVLLTERPIRLGDRVEVGSTYGDVVRIGGRSTWVRTNDNEVIIVPNSEFITNRVTNWTANDPQVRFSVAVGVSYDSDPQQVRSLLLEIAQNHPDVLKQPAPDVIFTEFADSSLNFELRVFTVKQVQTPAKLKSDLLFSIFEAFRQNQIEIPFPQRDLHLKSLPPSLADLEKLRLNQPESARSGESRGAA